MRTGLQATAFVAALAALSVPTGAGAEWLFAARQDFRTGDAPSCVAIADLDGDGARDVAVAAAGSNTISVLLGNGDGTFRARADYGAGAAPGFVAIADLDGDGDQDLVVANA